MSESATNVCFRHDSPCPLRWGALATALSVCTTEEREKMKRGMFTVPSNNRGNLCCFMIWSVSPWELQLGKAGFPAWLLAAADAACSQGTGPLTALQATAALLLLILLAPILAFHSSLHVQDSASSNCWERKDMGLIFPRRGKGMQFLLWNCKKKKILSETKEHLKNIWI